MNKWYKVGCSKCGAMITSLELGKTIVGFHDPLNEVKYEPDIITRVEHNGTIKQMLCPNCAGDSFDPTEYCTTPDILNDVYNLCLNNNLLSL